MLLTAIAGHLLALDWNPFKQVITDSLAGMVKSSDNIMSFLSDNRGR